MKVNLKAQPFIPEGFTLESHIPGDEAWEFDASQIELFVSDKQKKKGQVGTDLQKEVPNPFNANLLDFLLEHQELIPEEWKNRFVFFWGTVYRYSNGVLCIRCLIWGDGRWGWNIRWLDRNFSGFSPAAVLVSSQPSDFTPEEVKKLKAFASTLKD